MHTAARIGAVAGASEILASADTVSGLDGLTISEPSLVELKGIAEPVPIVRIDWRA